MLILGSYVTRRIIWNIEVHFRTTLGRPGPVGSARYPVDPVPATSKGEAPSFLETRTPPHPFPVSHELTPPVRSR